MSLLDHPLDNPLWSALTTRHAGFAITSARRPSASLRGPAEPDLAGSGAVRRYPRDVAPFVAAVERDAPGLDELDIAPGESVLSIGPRPAVPAGWLVEDFGTILQMTATAHFEHVDDGEIRELGAHDRAALLELTALVYPHYFRPRTPELGRYFGIHDGARLIAIAGERMAMTGHRELSAICTHPDALGRGLARRLVTYLAGDIAVSADVPFLHVSPANTRAVELYARNGFAVRIAIPFCALTRPAA